MCVVRQDQDPDAGVHSVSDGGGGLKQPPIIAKICKFSFVVNNKHFWLSIIRDIFLPSSISDDLPYLDFRDKMKTILCRALIIFSHPFNSHPLALPFSDSISFSISLSLPSHQARDACDMCAAGKMASTAGSWSTDVSAVIATTKINFERF